MKTINNERYSPKMTRTPLLFFLLFFSLPALLLGAGPRFDDKGIINGTHEKYIGQFVWSDEKIDFRNPDESKFRDTFDADDWIWGRFYLAQSMKNSLYDETGVEYNSFYFYYDVYANSESQEWEIDSYEYQGELLRRTTQQVWICIPSGTDDLAGWFNLVKSLPPGENEIRVDLRARTSSGEVFDTVFASGQFTLNKREGETPGYGEAFDEYEAGMTDPELEAEILKCIRDVADAYSWDETFYHVRIASDEWQIIRDRNTGEILEKYVIAYCFAMWPDGHFTVQQFAFKPYFGGIEFNGVIGDTQERIDLD